MDVAVFDAPTLQPPTEPVKDMTEVERYFLHDPGWPARSWKIIFTEAFKKKFPKQHPSEVERMVVASLRYQEAGFLPTFMMNDYRENRRLCLK